MGGGPGELRWLPGERSQSELVRSIRSVKKAQVTHQNSFTVLTKGSFWVNARSQRRCELREQNKSRLEGAST